MPSAAAGPLTTALIAHLKTNVPTCPRWYGAGAVPAGAVLPYGTVGDHNEDEQSFFGHSGSEMSPTIKWYSDYFGDAEVLSIWSEIYGSLHRQPLTVSGHVQLIGRLRLVTTYLDPHGVRNAVASYIARTLENA